MKVICDSCQTRYAIADDKVRGKTFKIKCKKCGTFMVIRPVGLDAAAAEPSDEAPAVDGPSGAAGDDLEKETRVFNYAEFEKLMADRGDAGDAPAAVAPGTSPRLEADAGEWYLLLGEEQVGPLTVAEVEERIRRGEVSAETYAWKEGLADWRPVREVEGLAGSLSSSGKFDAPSTSAAEQQNAPVFEEEATRAELPGASGVVSPASRTVQLGFSAQSVFAAASGTNAFGGGSPVIGGGPTGASNGGPPLGGLAPSVAPVFPSSASEPDRKLTGQRHEDSVLFSLKSLGVVNFRDGDDAANAKVVAPAPGAPRAAALGVSSDSRVGAPGSTSAGRSARDLEVPLSPSFVVSPVRDGMSSTVKVVLTLGVVALLATGGVLAWVLTRDEVPSRQRADGLATATPPPPAAAPPASIPAPAPGPSASSAPSQLGLGSPSGASPTGAAGVVAAAASGTVAAAGSVATVAPEEEEEEIVEKGKKKKVKKKKVAATASAAAPVMVAAAPSAAPSAPAAPEAAPEPGPAPEAAPVAAPKEQPKSADSDIQAILEGKVPSRKTQDVPKPEEALPEALDKSQIKKVIRRNMSGVIRCYNTKVSDKGAVKGTLQVTFTIFGTGRTGGIRVQKPDFWGSDFVGCAGNAVSRWKFPRFKGDEIEITYPFVLGGF